MDLKVKWSPDTDGINARIFALLFKLNGMLREGYFPFILEMVGGCDDTETW